MKQEQTISESELEMMQLVWEQGGSALFAPLMERLEQKGYRWKANTVLTFLTRLTEKGMLRVEKEGRLNRYIAVVGEKEYLEGVTQSFVARVYGGNAKGLVASLLRQECLTRQDIDELSDFWEEAKK